MKPTLLSLFLFVVDLDTTDVQGYKFDCWQTARKFRSHLHPIWTKSTRTTRMRWADRTNEDSTAGCVSLFLHPPRPLYGFYSTLWLEQVVLVIKRKIPKSFVSGVKALSNRTVIDYRHQKKMLRATAAHHILTDDWNDEERNLFFLFLLPPPSLSVAN